MRIVCPKTREVLNFLYSIDVRIRNVQQQQRLLIVMLMGLLFAANTCAEDSTNRDSSLAEVPSASVPQLNITAITVLAERQYQKMGDQPAPVMLVRYHESDGKVVHIWYSDELRSKFESDLSGPVDYSTSRKSDPQTMHLFLEEGNHQEYSIGGGANRLQIHEYSKFGHMNYLEWSGLDLKGALQRNWNSTQYDVIQTENVEGGLNGEYHLVLEVRAKNDGGKLVQKIDGYSVMKQPLQFARLEYQDTEGVYMVVENGDFREVNGLFVPYKMVVSELRNEQTWTHTIQRVIINPELKPELMDSPVPAPGAGVVVYRQENGQIVKYEDNMTDTQRVTASIVNEVSRELMTDPLEVQVSEVSKANLPSNSASDLSDGADVSTEGKSSLKVRLSWLLAGTAVVSMGIGLLQRFRTSRSRS